MKRPRKDSGRHSSSAPEDETGPVAEIPPEAAARMRTIEVVHLTPDGTAQHSAHRVPDTSVYEDIASACARGTLVRTQTGPVAIEDLVPGDTVLTSRGLQPVLWIGSAALSRARTDEDGSGATHLTRLLADTFGPGRPEADLVLGPAARLRHVPKRPAEVPGGGQGPEARLLPIAAFTDGVGIFEVTPPSPVQLFHLAFRHHAVFSASGIEIESHHPGVDLGDRLGPKARRLYLSLFPHVTDWTDFGPLSLPRASRDWLDDMNVA